MKNGTSNLVLFVLTVSIVVGLITDLAMQGTGQFNPPSAPTTTTTTGTPTVTPTMVTSAPV